MAAVLCDLCHLWNLSLAHPRAPPSPPEGLPARAQAGLKLGPSRAQAGLKPGRAQAGPKLGPSWAQAGPKLGPSQISGNLEIWDLEIWKFGIPKIQKLKVLKIKIRVAQNVRKVWISRKKTSWPHFMPFQAFVCMGRKNQRKKNAGMLLGGPMWHGPY